ncbi:hypothetical protein [Amycolatopsis lexingtonensis]|uniref:hypothetical protein n=1 Tax=Amycolatopsis lexingtonensis TaxID=218822 RepID=UPI003F728E73
MTQSTTDLAVPGIAISRARLKAAYAAHPPESLPGVVEAVGGLLVTTPGPVPQYSVAAAR